MSLSRPTIVTPIAAFDATVGTTIYYNISGGELPTKNKFQIFNEDYTIVWDSEFVDGYNNYVVIPPDTTHLVNGTKYYILVQTGLGNEVSPVSYMVEFYCYTTPVFEFTDVPSIVPSSTYAFGAEYSQAQNELLNTYIFTLYNTSNIPIATSGSLYASSLTPTQGIYSLSYNFDGMLDGQTFKIGLTGETLQHTKIEIAPVEFQVQYDEKAPVGAITLKSVCKEGKVVVTSAIDANNGIPDRDVTYIDNKEADLRSNSVLWDNVETEQDFTIRTVFRAAWSYDDSAFHIIWNGQMTNTHINIGYQRYDKISSIVFHPFGVSYVDETGYISEIGQRDFSENDDVILIYVNNNIVGITALKDNAHYRYNNVTYTFPSAGLYCPFSREHADDPDYQVEFIRNHSVVPIMRIFDDEGVEFGLITYRYQRQNHSGTINGIVDCVLSFIDYTDVHSNELYGIPNDLTKFVLQIRHKNNEWTLSLGMLEQPTPSLYMDTNNDVHEVWFDELTPYINYTIDSTETEDNLTATYNDNNIKPEFSYSENNGDVKITI